MPRAIWKGHITFGMVSIPVALYPGARPDEVSFDLLDRRDFSPIGYLKINKTTRKEVPREEIVRGFRLEDGQYVVVSDKELDEAGGERAKTIDIKEFVASHEIRPFYYETPYYLEPLPAGDKGYSLLRGAMNLRGKVGIARVVLRTRERVAAVFSEGPMLLLNLLRYPSELRDRAELRSPAGQVSEKEIKLAQRLVEEMAAPFDPKEFRDENGERVPPSIRSKAEAGEARAAREEGEPPAAKRPAPRDLMTLLKESVARAGQGHA